VGDGEEAWMTRQQAMLAWVLGSAALMVLASFGPWVKALGMSVSGTDGGNDGWFVVVAALVAAGLFLRRRDVSAAGYWPIAGGVLGTFVAAYDRTNLEDAIDEGGALAESVVQVGWGLNLAIIASISFAVSGAVWLVKHDAIFGDTEPAETPAGDPAVAEEPPPESR
jgi:MYXO-CTERM domain-containing protein